MNFAAIRRITAKKALLCVRAQSKRPAEARSERKDMHAGKWAWGQSAGDSIVNFRCNLAAI